MDKIKVEDPDKEHQNDKYLPILIKELDDICIYFLTTEGLIASWSGACNNVKEYEKEEILGQHFRILFPERRQKAGIPEKELDSAIKNGKFITYDWRRRKSGEEFWAYVILFPLHDDNEKLLGLAKITQDLNQEYTVKKELLQRNRQLDEAAHIIAHDLKAPLRNIKSLTDILLKDVAPKLDEEQNNMLNTLGESVKKMHERIDAIIKYSKATNAEAEKVKVNMTQLVKEVVEFIRPGENVQVNIAHDLPTLYLPATALFQVFQNLIDNSIKYNDKKEPIIEVGYKLKEGVSHFMITDNGPGIEKKDHKKIFKLFNKLPGTGKEGTGIGLAIVERIITSLGGEIWITSKMGKGSVFHFTIPDTAMKSRPENI